MTLAAPARVAVPVAASAALGARLAGTPQTGVLLGAGGRAAWARVGDEVLVIGPQGGVRMPNGVEVPARVLQGLVPGDGCALQGGTLTVGAWTLSFAASWDPHPVVPRIDPALLRRRAASLRGSFPPVGDCGLGAALAAGDASAVAAAARCLIGKGPGLTPLGDDVLTGALGGSLLLGEAVGNRALLRLVAGVTAGICALASERTTALSATLLRHACRGEVDDASAALLLALCGRGDLGAALDSLLAMGHSSGTGLATGLLAGATAAGGAP